MGGPKNPKQTPEEWFNQLGKNAERFFGALGNDLKKDFEDLTKTVTTGQLPDDFVKQEQERVEEKIREAETALAKAMQQDKTLVRTLSAVDGNMTIAAQLSKEHIDKIDRAKAENKKPPSIDDLIKAIKQKDQENATAAKILLDSTAQENPNIATFVDPTTGSMPATALQIAREHINANIIAGLNKSSQQGFSDKLKKEDTRREDMARRMLASSLGNKNSGQATLLVFVAKDENMDKALRCTREYVDSIEEAKSRGEPLPSPQNYARNLSEMMVSVRNTPAPKRTPQPPRQPTKDALAIAPSLEDARHANNSTSSFRSTLTEPATDLAIQSKRRESEHQKVEEENTYQSEARNNRIILNISGEHVISKQIEQENRQDTVKLAQEAARLFETMNDIKQIVEDGGTQFEDVETNVQNAAGSTDRAAAHLEEAQKTQQEVIRMRLMIATIACGAVSVGCAGWLLQTLGGNGYLTLAAAIVTTLAVAATATCGGLFAAKQKQAKAQQTGQDNVQPESP